MTPHLSMIVTDSSPLITLALAGELNLLLAVQPSLIIPDMVRYEVTRYLEKPGAQEVADWIRLHDGNDLSVASTEVFEEFQIILSVRPDAKTKGRGEASASEVLQREMSRGAAGAILLYEDSDVVKENFLVRLPDNVLILSTAEFLHGLHGIGKSRDPDEILDRVTSVRGERINERSARGTASAAAREGDWSLDM